MILILAGTFQQAKLRAKDNNVRPLDWQYVACDHDLFEHNSNPDTRFVRTGTWRNRDDYVIFQFDLAEERHLLLNGEQNELH